MKLYACLLLILAALFSFFLAPARSFAQEVPSPLCEIEDSTAAYAAGITDILHLFGSDTETYPNEFSVDSLFPAFDQVFDLYVSDSVSERWSSSEWEDIISAIMNNDTTTTDDDVFGIVWGYFTREEADLNESHAFVRFFVGGVEYDHIDLLVYDTSDLPCPCTTDFGVACRGASSAVANRLLLNASELPCPNACNPSIPCAAITDSQFMGLAVAHELQHICYAINGSAGYSGVNETLSTLAEYFLDSWRDLTFDVSYDASIMDNEECDIPRPGVGSPKYHVYKPWMIYLYEVFMGDSGDPTDDLLYRWIRNDAEFAYKRLRLEELANVLWDDDFQWLGGANAVDRLHRVFANYAAAKFANAPEFTTNSEFGLGPVNTLEDLGFFLDNSSFQAPNAEPEEPVDCPPYLLANAADWNVRIVPPSYVLDDSDENTTTLVSDIYTAADQSMDYIDVFTYGTDFLVFRADDYFDDSNEHEFQLSIAGNALYKVPNTSPLAAVTVYGWVMGYSTDEVELPTHSEDLVFIEPLTFTPSVTVGTPVSASVTVTEFGRAIKAVVVVIAAGWQYPQYFTDPLNAFVYEYEYGVVTPGAEERTWAGDVFVLGDVTVPDDGALSIAAGTSVRIFNTDLAEGGADEERIEINVEGEFTSVGTAGAPIVFESWNPTTTEDWVGFYFDNASDGGTFTHCSLSRAEYAIESYVNLALRNTVFEDCRYAGVAAQDGTLFVKNCTFTDPGTWGVFLVAADATVRNTVIDNATATALNVQANATLVARNSQFLNSDKGIFVGGNTTANVDSTCAINSNVIGIHYYNTGTTPVLKNSTINSNTGNGVLCDNSSHPLIQANTVRYNALGIYATNSSAPTIKSNMIKSNANGVGAASNADPDIGHCCSSGNNTIAYSSQKHVLNFNNFDIDAENNCWNVITGDCLPPASKLYGDVNTSSPICCTTTSGASEGFPMPEEPLPSETMLVSIVPNPFNPSTTIHYSLASSSMVRISVYDVAGRLVQDLVNRAETAGLHHVHWNGTTVGGTTAASGIYFVKLSAGVMTRTMKMVLLK